MLPSGVPILYVDRPGGDFVRAHWAENYIDVPASHSQFQVRRPPGPWLASTLAVGGGTNITGHQIPFVPQAGDLWRMEIPITQLAFPSGGPAFPQAGTIT